MGTRMRGERLGDRNKRRRRIGPERDRRGEAKKIEGGREDTLSVSSLGQQQ
jgi:hypothetical protein